MMAVADMLTELAHREKQQNIHPDPDTDAFMKVSCLRVTDFDLVRTVKDSTCNCDSLQVAGEWIMNGLQIGQ